MCGRFTIVMNDQMVALVDELGVPVHLQTQYNVAPTDHIPVLLEEQGQWQWFMAKWWFTPSWSPDPNSTKFSMFNAKSETLEQSKAFKGAFRYKRCVVPATSFFEWRTEGGQKTPFEVFNPERPLLMAGIYDVWGDSLLSSAILTTASAPAFEAIHKRMPVFLTPESVATWLSSDVETAILKPLFASQLPHPLSIHRVDPAINNSRNKQAATILGADIVLS